MQCPQTVTDLRSVLDEATVAGKSIGFVPTMGALHAGHIGLVETAVRENDLTVCSIFVNPTQFNNPGDLAHYPRQEEQDLSLLREAGCDLAFLPTPEAMYPEGDDLSRYELDFGPMATVMEGQHRPGHFRGVGIIVGKFFDLIRPNRAYFGEKDFQQLLVVKALNRMLDQGVDVIGVPTFREPDGLAMSSRNLRLNTAQRAEADLIYRTLQGARKHWADFTVEGLQAWAAEQFAGNPQLTLEYFDIANAEDLQPIRQWSDCSSAIACTSAFAGEVRLIDNMILFP
ncbi:MAG: pantoate--beta-alanine ligase [Bacteroidota bacterium]